LDISGSSVVNAGVASALYNCLEDSYEENRMAALNILKGRAETCGISFLIA
jgi:hypothetical protein